MMKLNFIDYVYNHQLINADQREKVIKSVDTVSYDQTLKNQFDDGAMDCETNLYHAQLLVDNEFMKLEHVSRSISQFINFCYFDEQVLTTTINALDDIFVEGYQKIIAGTLSRLLRTSGEVEGVEEIEFFERDHFVYQKLVDNAQEFQVLTGLYIDENTSRQITDEYNTYISNKYNIPKLETTEESIVDFFKELLNNVNGGCTYKFDIDFSLELPENVKNVFLEASPVYRIKFRIKEYTIYFIVVLGDDYVLTN